MKPKILLIVTSDPRTSARPAEAVRIAAGVGTWKKADMLLYLHGPAVLALGEFTDELVDDDNFSRYLPILRDQGRPVYVQKSAPELADLGESPLQCEELDAAGLAALVSQSNSVLRF